MITVPVGRTTVGAGPVHRIVARRTAFIVSVWALPDTGDKLDAQHSALGSLFFLCPAASTPRGRGQAAPVNAAEQGEMDPRERQQSMMVAVSNALVALHKDQFGRGPTKARSHFAGPDALMCVMEDVLLPAERKLVALGQQASVRETRSAYQTATAADFIATVEQIVYRKVRAFASAVDPDANTVFENFYFEPLAPDDTR